MANLKGWKYQKIIPSTIQIPCIQAYLDLKGLEQNPFGLKWAILFGKPERLELIESLTFSIFRDSNHLPTSSQKDLFQPSLSYLPL